jgi:hypothetical protein
MHEQVTISRAKDEACSKLEGILPKPMLPESASFCTGAGFSALGEEKVEQIAGFQFLSNAPRLPDKFLLVPISGG